MVKRRKTLRQSEVCRMDALVVPLAELDRSSTAIAGGKAANLGELLRAGFPVPDGVCVTTEAYRRVIDASRIGPRLSKLLEALDVEDADKLAATGTAIRALFYETPVPEDVSAAVIAAVRILSQTASQQQNRGSTKSQ